MVSWVGDGLMAGYSTTENQLVEGRYHFASPGTVDLNAVTRFQYSLVGVNPNKYPNRLALSATFNFVSADIEAHSDPARWLKLGAFLAPANKFAAGVTPTPRQILDVGYEDLGWGYSGEEAFTPGTQDFTIHGWYGQDLEPNTKYWLLLLPCFYNSNLSGAPIRPMKNIDVNTMGRALSFWTNRRPSKPVITSPANGLTVAAGSVFNFQFTPGDGDSLGTDRFDRDLAGVQVAYAAIPTPDNPTPQWRTLLYRRSDNSEIVPSSVYMNMSTVFPGDGRINMLEDLGFPILFGAAYPEEGGQASLPAGDWQIRVRTADYGNPYPRLANFAASKYPGFTSFNQVPDSNQSDWSDPITVHVFQQVPPPIPLSPKDAVAIPETAVTRLVWKYRNTFDPPYNQYTRTVQVKEVREDQTKWRTIRDKQIASAAWIEMPAGYSTDPLGGATPNLVPDEYLTDPGFESGLLDGWVSYSGSHTLSNISGTAGAGVHTGTKALDLDGVTILGGFLYTGVTPVDPGHNTLDVSLWLRTNPDVGDISVGAAWKDASGNIIGSEENGTGSPTVVLSPPVGGWPTGWRQVVLPSFKRPNGGVYPYIGILGITADFAVTPAEWLRLDDASITTSYEAPDIEPLTLHATTQYEWRVKVEDDSFTEDGASSYSDSARWWVVSGNGTGITKPDVENTTEGATLGCGTHRVFVYRRGGKERVGELTGITHVDWTRVRDDISVAKIVVEDWSVDCGNLLALLQCWAYELVIFRDNGYSVDRVWEGPITLLTYRQESVTIDAKDVMGYAYRRIIRQTMNDSVSGDTVTSRANRILQNAFAPDDPNVLAYLQPIYNASDSMEYRNIPAYSRTAFEEVDDMAANSGLDYTAVGRAILLWGTKSRIGTLPEFRDEDLGASPIVSEYGMSMANVYSVSDGNGIHGEADRLDENGEDPIYGLVEMLSSTWATDSPEDTGTYTQQGIETIRKSFEAHAERSIADRYPPPVVVRVPDNTTLNPSTVLSIQQLVPGVVIPLRSTGTLRTVVADQKLDSLSVKEEGGVETITVTLSPFSREDTAMAEGGEEIE